LAIFIIVGSDVISRKSQKIRVFRFFSHLKKGFIGKCSYSPLGEETFAINLKIHFLCKNI
jgi:hypothetical protein